jgi:hypothetical protein
LDLGGKLKNEEFRKKSSAGHPLMHARKRVCRSKN